MPEDVTLVRDFAIIMAVGGGALALLSRFGQPPILGYLLAGVIIGPFTLPHPPVQDTETVRLLADLGLVLLLFAMGLEFGWKRIRQVGLRVIFIGVIEITFLIALGYEAGILLGWNGTEAFSLGAALSISSSAILAKVLRDTGRLRTTPGQLIIGILVVEDFAAVILLVLLSAIATTGTATASDIGFLVGKLALFAVVALTLGGLLAPRVINFVARFHSQEMMLVTGLALCFSLALVATELGISAATGAFLIGAVLGDTEHSDEMIRIMSPVRDMFAAIFFVSIGMLVDLAAVAEFIVPALIVFAIFLLGKILANTIGTFVAGHDGRTSLTVGMSMPQIGEFSLAMVKVGHEGGTIGPLLYPVITVTTALTSFTFPYIFRAADSATNLLERRSPRLLRAYLTSLSGLLASLRSAFTLRGEVSMQIQRSSRVLLLNLGIIVVIITTGTFLLGFTQALGDSVHLPEGIVGLVVGGIVVTLCVPPVVIMWRALGTLADRVSLHALRRRDSRRVWGREGLRQVLRNSLLILATVLIAIVSVPFVSHLLILGPFTAPIPALLLVLLIALLARTAFKIHLVLEETFTGAFYEAEAAEPEEEQKEAG
jgi:CPA2 family monovalent cation:H+ antiporter-2